MDLKIRPGTLKDAEICGNICYEAFKAVAEHHNFPVPTPSPDMYIELLSKQLSHPDFSSFVAEDDGRIVGSSFIDGRSDIVAIGPVTVDLSLQNRSIGRQLMHHVLDRIQEQRFDGARLTTEAYNNRSFALYAKLGFEARELLSVIQGPAISKQIPGHDVRPATAEDLEVCNQLSRSIHGHDRSRELLDSIHEGTATVVEHEGRISGSTTSIAFFGHAVGNTNEDLKALIGAAPEYLGSGFFLPTRNGELLRWCLANDLRVVYQAILMSIGLYTEPAGIFLPTVQQ